MAKVEEPVDWGSPDFYPEDERRRLLGTVRATLQENAQKGAIGSLWVLPENSTRPSRPSQGNEKFGCMAIVSAGSRLCEGEEFLIGVVHSVSLQEQDERTVYRLVSRVGGSFTFEHTIEPASAYNNLSGQTAEDDDYACQLLAETDFRQDLTVHFAEFFHRQFPGTVVDPSVEALLAEDSQMVGWQRYGEFLAQQHPTQRPLPPTHT